MRAGGRRAGWRAGGRAGGRRRRAAQATTRQGRQRARSNACDEKNGGTHPEALHRVHVCSAVPRRAAEQRTKEARAYLQQRAHALLELLLCGILLRRGVAEEAGGDAMNRSLRHLTAPLGDGEVMQPSGALGCPLFPHPKANQSCTTQRGGLYHPNPCLVISRLFQKSGWEMRRSIHFSGL